MESTFSSDHEKTAKLIKKFTIPKLQESNSISPRLSGFKSATKLPPILLNLKLSSNSNKTPKPEHSPLKLSPVQHSTSRIHSIIKRNLFPFNKFQYKNLPRAPSVNDIEPLALFMNNQDNAQCRQCKKSSMILNSVHISEYKV